MIIYIANYIVITCALLLSQLMRFTKRTRRILYILVTLYFLWFIGLRHEIGGDWYAYLYHYENVETFSVESLLSWNPGYVLLEYISKLFGFGIYGVNTMCAFIFILNFIYFVRSLNISLPFAFAVAYPYLIMVVAMGYTRQATALGFILGFIASLYKDKIRQSFTFLICAFLFHESAIVSSILYFRNNFLSLRKPINYVVIISLSFLSTHILHSERIHGMFIAYILEKMESAGALMRLSLNLLASFLLLVFYSKWKKYFSDFTFWSRFAIISMLLTLFAVISGVTTFADRLLLYFYPIQIVVFTRLQHLIIHNYLKVAYMIFVISLYLSVLLVFLLFGVHRDSWVPYNNLLFLL